MINTYYILILIIYIKYLLFKPLNLNKYFLKSINKQAVASDSNNQFQIIYIMN